MPNAQSPDADPAVNAPNPPPGGGSPDDNRKIIASAVAIVSLCVVVIVLVILSILAMRGMVFENPDADVPVLRTSWNIFVWFLELGTALAVIYGGLFAVVSTGLTYLGTLYTSKRALTLLVAIAIAGIVFSSVVMFQIDRGFTAAIPMPGQDSETISAALSSKSTVYPTPAVFKPAADKLLISVIGWFAAFIAAQLGISLKAPNGALKGK